MELTIEELEAIERSIKEEISDRLLPALIKANQSGRLEALLSLLGMSDLLKADDCYETYEEGKIVILGESKAKEKELAAIAQSLGIDKTRFEFFLEYDKIKTYNYRKYQYAPQYRVIMFGPIPHSTSGKEDSGSMISNMESQTGYPRIVRLTSNNTLKITKSNFREALTNLLSERYIA